ncbi:diguanylate cyclase, partial [Pseudomonas aeruginosa]
GEEADLARFGDSIFAALFKGKTPEQAQAALQRLLKKVENHLFELNGRSAQATLSIGVAGLDEKTAKAQDVMNRAHRCADDAARKGGSQIKQYNPAEELAAAAQRG